MVYDINPLKILEVGTDNKCKLITNKKDKHLDKIESSFGDLPFHLRNSSNLIPFKNKYLGIGHAVLEYKNYTDINKFLIPDMNNSLYSNTDKEYFKRFYKLYLGFFYVLDMDQKEIIQLSPFFQLPSEESKHELIFFPTSIHTDKNNMVNISYSLGDNRSYVSKIHSKIIEYSLYDKSNINMHMNYNINLHYYLELIRTLRKIHKFDTTRYLVYKGSRNSKSKKKSKHKTKRNRNTV